MARILHIPKADPTALWQPARLHFGKWDRIIIDHVDYRCVETNDDGHVLQAAHDKNIKKGFSHNAMGLEAARPDFRHDRNWYSKTSIKARMRANVADLRDLPYEKRQYILWKESIVREYMRLLKAGETTCGDVGMEDAIPKIYATVSRAARAEADNGRRKRADRPRMIFDTFSVKSLRRWLKLLVEADFDPLALCDRYHKSGHFGEKLTPEQSAMVGKYTLRYLSMLKPSKQDVWDDMDREIQNFNKKRIAAARKSRIKSKTEPTLIKTPSYDRLSRQIDMMEEFHKSAGREGPGKTAKEFNPVGDGLQDVLRPYQHVEMDHWTVDLQTICIQSGIWDKLSRAKQRQIKKANTKRWYLGIAMCRTTHCILGMFLSRTPSVEAGLQLLEMAVSSKKRFMDSSGAITPWDMAGLMEWLFTDGGPAFNNGRFRTAVAGLKVNPAIGPGGIPHLRGMVERMFRNFAQKLLEKFEGRTFSGIDVKGDYDSVARAGTTVDELCYVLVRYVVDCFHNTQQKALNWETPRSCSLKLTKLHGVDPCPNWDIRRNNFGIELERVNSAAGIRFLGIQYRSKKLHAYFRKHKNIACKIRVHPGNLGAISVKIGKGWLTVRARSEFEGVTAEQWIAAEARLRAYGAHLKKLTAHILRKAFNDIEKIAETGRKRADISDTIMSKKALLHADRMVEVFAEYPDEQYDLEPEAEGDLFGGGTKVTGQRSPRRPTASAKRVSPSAGKRARTPLKASAKPAAKGTSKPLGKAPGRKPRAAPVKTTRTKSTPVRVPTRRRGNRS
jgi:putative transposase